MHGPGRPLRGAYGHHHRGTRRRRHPAPRPTGLAGLRRGRVRLPPARPDHGGRRPPRTHPAPDGRRHRRHRERPPPRHLPQDQGGEQEGFGERRLSPGPAPSPSDPRRATKDAGAWTMDARAQTIGRRARDHARPTMGSIRRAGGTRREDSTGECGRDPGRGGRTGIDGRHTGPAPPLTHPALRGPLGRRPRARHPGPPLRDPGPRAARGTGRRMQRELGQPPRPQHPLHRQPLGRQGPRLARPPPLPGSLAPRPRLRRPQHLHFTSNTLLTPTTPCPAHPTCAAITAEAGPRWPYRGRLGLGPR